MLILAGSKSFSSATEVFTHLMLKFVIQKVFLGLCTPCSFTISSVDWDGGVNLVGMIQIMASRYCWAQTAVRMSLMVALVLDRSYSVMPDFLEHQLGPSTHFNLLGSLEATQDRGFILHLFWF